jgi:hypothetical protein
MKKNIYTQTISKVGFWLAQNQLLKLFEYTPPRGSIYFKLSFNFDIDACSDR